MTLTNIDVADPLLTSLVCKIDTLAPGDSGSCTATGNVYYLTQQDIDSGSVKNTATATGQDPKQEVVTDTDSATVNFPGAPSLVLTKTATLDKTVVPPTGRSDPGDTITYTFSVKNTGNVTLTNIDVADPLLTSLVCKIDTLAPGDSGSCTATGNVYYLTQQDIDSGSIKNTATATGQDPKQEVVTDTDSATVNFPGVPKLVLTKKADKSTYVVNDIVNYTLVATNTGNVTLDGVSISDTTLGSLTCTQPVNLAPTDKLTCTGSHTMSQANVDAGKFDNTANAAGTFDSSPVNADPASVEVTTTQNAALGLTKTDDLNPGTFNTLGQVVTFTLTATNNGNVTLHNVSVGDDPALDGFSCTVGGNAVTFPLDSLAPGDAIVCTGTHSITQSDLVTGNLVDTASASSNEFTPADVGDTISANSTNLSISKTDNSSSYAAGESDQLHHRGRQPRSIGRNWDGCGGYGPEYDHRHKHQLCGKRNRRLWNERLVGQQYFIHRRCHQCRSVELPDYYSGWDNFDGRNREPGKYGQRDAWREPDRSG